MSEEKTDLHPQWRQKELQTVVLPDGGIGLHRFGGFNPDTTCHGLKNEKPWHRMAAYMLNAGRTNSEIAMAAGVHPTTISILRAQKWFQELCATIANNEGEEITGAIQSYTLEAVEEIHDLASNSESETIRLRAWNLLLEQGRGKAIQRIVTANTKTNLPPEDEMVELTTELQNLRRSRTPAPAQEPPAFVSTTIEKET